MLDNVDWDDVNTFFERLQPQTKHRRKPKPPPPAKPVRAAKPKPQPVPTPEGRKVPRAKYKPKRELKTANPITLSQPDKRDQYEAVKAFCKSIRKGRSKIYVGIDPGSTGAMGLIHPTDNSQTTAIDLPTTMVALKTKKKGKAQYRSRYDNAALWRIFQLLLVHRERLVICLEKGAPRGTDTGLVGYSVGISYGMWPLFLHSHGVILEEVIPLVWKSKMGLLGSDKEVSRYMAQQLFPAAPLFNVGHDDRAESLLIAEYFRRTRGDVKS